MSDERANLPSASAMPRIVHCAGSPAAEALFPGEEQTEVALDGTQIHKAMETGSDDGLVVSQKDVAENMRKIEVEAIAQWRAEFDLAEPKIFREQRLWIRDSALHLVASAKPDVVAIAGGNQVPKSYALALDFKSGFLDAEPAELNWQLKTQALAVRDEHAGLVHIRAAIIQHRFGSRYDPVDFWPQDLSQAYAELKFYIHLTKQPDAPRVPGGWCRYCRARGTSVCPESKAYALIPNVLSPIRYKDDAYRSVAMLTTEQLSFIRSRKALIISILDAVEDQLKQLPAEELASVGLELKPNSPMRSLPNIQRVYEVLATNGLIEDDEEFRSLCKVSVGAVEELIVPRLQKKYNLETVKSATAECDKLLAPIVVPVPKNPSLKPIKKK